MDYLEELQTAYTAVVADALDQLGLRDRVLDPGVRAMPPRRRSPAARCPCTSPTATPSRTRRTRTGSASSRQSTWRCHRHRSRRRHSRCHLGRALLVRCAGTRCAAAISDGFIRDVTLTAQVGFPVFARGCSPLDTLGRARLVSVGDDIQCGGVTVSRGDYMVADADGVAAVPANAVDGVVGIVRQKASRETGGRGSCSRVRACERSGIATASFSGRSSGIPVVQLLEPRDPDEPEDAVEREHDRLRRLVVGQLAGVWLGMREGDERI